MTRTTLHGIDNMKKILYIIGFVLLSQALFTGCDNMNGQPDGNAPAQITKEFLVFMDPYTRTSLREDYSVEWSAGDKIAVSDGKELYEFAAAETGCPVRFTGEAPAADKYFAIYPYTDETIWDEDGVIINIPVEQTVSSAAPSPDADYWLGESRGSILQMRNACGHVFVSLEGDNITAITLEGVNGEGLAGKMMAKISSDSLSIIPTEDASSIVKILPASGETFSPGLYCVAVAPIVLKRGLLLSFDRLGGERSYRTLTDSISISGSSIVNIGNWDLTAPELGFVTTGSVMLKCDKALLNGSLAVTNFAADRMSCGFEYKTASATEWRSVTCQQPSVDFSYELVLNSAEPHVFRAWAKVNGTDEVIYGAESEELTPETFDLQLVFHGQEGRDLLVTQWGWKTNGNNSSTKRGYDMNGLTYNYTYNGVDYPFTFWALQSGKNAAGEEATTGGYCFRHTDNVPDEALCLSNLGKAYATDGHPAWMQFPCPEGMKLVVVDAELKNSFSGHICTAVNEDGTWAGESLGQYSKNSSFPITLENTSAGTRYYFTTEHIDLPRMLSLTLTYLYTE